MARVINRPTEECVRGIVAEARGRYSVKYNQGNLLSQDEVDALLSGTGPHDEIFDREDLQSRVIDYSPDY